METEGLQAMMLLQADETEENRMLSAVWRFCGKDVDFGFQTCIPSVLTFEERFRKRSKPKQKLLLCARHL